MPTEQTILDLRDQLESLAQSLYTTQIQLAQSVSQQVTRETQISGIRAAMLNGVLTERFEINNRLVYTNDDQRKTAMMMAEDSSVVLQGLKDSCLSETENQATLKAQIERLRNLFRKFELVLAYYANNQTA